MKKLLCYVFLIIAILVSFVSCKKAVSIIGAEINADGDLIITMSDSSTQNLGKVKGADGKDGNNGSNENSQCLEFYPLPDGNYAVSLGNAILLENIVIPATYQNKAVTKVIFGWPEGISPTVKYITLPESITYIGESAFASCSSLENINIPSGVTYIGDYAFNGCSSLDSITLPNGVTSIGYSTFNGCSNLDSITLPNGVTSIDDYAFYGCSSLESVTIPNNVTSIGSNAFYGCSSLKSIAIPNTVTSIGDYAFCHCSALQSVEIGIGITEIFGWTFYNCTNLSSVTFADCENWYVACYTSPGSDNRWGDYDVDMSNPANNAGELRDRHGNGGYASGNVRWYQTTD